jgi:UDP-2,3-diacylglucosamine pyrophosphatase LpxH
MFFITLLTAQPTKGHTVMHHRIEEQKDIDAIIISDIHLGSPLCQAELLAGFLGRIELGEIRPRQLILNGDVFDSINFHRLSKHHWRVLSLLRKLSDRVAITWVCGNHDGPADTVSQLLGVNVRDEHLLNSADRSVLILHGHTFDEFLYSHPVIGWIGDFLYRGLQKVDRSHRAARKAKSASKTFLRCARKIREKATAYASSLGHDIVICGHTHHAEIAVANNITTGVTYINSGCWTEIPCTYITISNGKAGLHFINPIEQKETVPTILLPDGKKALIGSN